MEVDTDKYYRELNVFEKKSISNFLERVFALGNINTKDPELQEEFKNILGFKLVFDWELRELISNTLRTNYRTKP